MHTPKSFIYLGYYWNISVILLSKKLKQQKPFANFKLKIFLLDLPLHKMCELSEINTEYSYSKMLIFMKLFVNISNKVITKLNIIHC